MSEGLLVTGGTGMLGKALQKHLLSGDFLSSKDGDLKSAKETSDIFDRYQPQCVVHMACCTGGIKYAASHQYDLFYDNSLMNINVINECVKRRIRLIAISSAGAFPTSVARPAIECNLHDGPAYSARLGYSYAKRMIEVQANCAVEQYGSKLVVLFPSNLYGPTDLFCKEKGHMVASMIVKIHNAINEGSSYVQLLGTGKPLIQNTYGEDLALAIVKIIGSDICGLYNFATNELMSVSGHADLIKDFMGYDGDILFEDKKGEQYRKDVDSSKLLSLLGGWDFTPIRDGIRQTCDFFIRNNR